MKYFYLISLYFFLSQTPAMAGVFGYVGGDGVIQFYNVQHPATVPRVQPVPPQAPKKTPVSVESLINQAQRRYGVDSALIKAVIKAESNFDNTAVSKAGAKGLMQIMPSNFKALGIIDPHDSKQNIMGGVQYLRELILRYQNRLDLALAAYNAGPDVVDKYRKIPPYKETKDYVSKVIRLYKRYKGLH